MLFLNSEVEMGTKMVVQYTSLGLSKGFGTRDGD